MYADSKRQMLVWSPCGRLLMITAVIAFTSLAGCRDSSETDSSSGFVSPFKGKTVRLVVPQDYGIADQVKLVTDSWAAESEAEVQIIERPLHPGAPYPEETEDAANTVFAIPITALPEWEDAGFLKPFPDEDSSGSMLRWDGMFIGPLATIAAREDKRLAVPVACPSLKLFYRQDLLDKAKLEAPRTWEEYAALVENQKDWADGLPIFEPWSEAFRPTMYVARSIGYAKHPENYSVFFDVTDGSVMIDSPGFVRGMERSLEILPQLSADSLKLSPGDCRRMIVDGKAAMAIGIENGQFYTEMAFGPGWSADAEEVPRNPDSAGDREYVIGVSPLPGAENVYDNSSQKWTSLENEKPNHVTLGGFAGIVLVTGGPPSDETGEMLSHFAARLSLEQPSMSFPDPCKTFLRKENYHDVPAWVGSNLTPGERQSVAEAIRDDLDTENYVCDLMFVGRERFRDALATAVNMAISGEKEPAAALGLAKDEWDKLCDEIGREKVRQSYRKTVGLRFVQ